MLDLQSVIEEEIREFWMSEPSETSDINDENWKYFKVACASCCRDTYIWNNEPIPEESFITEAIENNYNKWIAMCPKKVKDIICVEEKIIKEMIVKITDKSYVPGDWVGVSDVKSVRLDDVINILESYIPERNSRW